mmetsp:Transcript_16693/g.67333  ORF Transcript_16693/g.67333 Transcript_16693/m.67333 type:complete len:373 (+) Transcript_16693:236-1354(+)
MRELLFRKRITSSNMHRDDERRGEARPPTRCFGVARHPCDAAAQPESPPSELPKKTLKRFRLRLDIEVLVALPGRQVGIEGVAVVPFEREIGVDGVVAEARAERRRGVELVEGGAQRAREAARAGADLNGERVVRIVQVGALGVLGEREVGRRGPHAVRARRGDGRGKQVRIGGHVGEADFEARRAVGHAHEHGPVVAGPRDGVGRPRRAGGGRRRVEPFVRVDRRVRVRRDAGRLVEDAGEEPEREVRETERVGVIVDRTTPAEVGARRGVVQRDVGVAARARAVGEGLGHEGDAAAEVLGEGARHVLEENDAVGRLERVGVVPVDFELAVGVLVVGLVRPPAQGVHRLRQLGHEIVASHERVRVVARLGL